MRTPQHTVMTKPPFKTIIRLSSRSSVGVIMRNLDKEVDQKASAVQTKSLLYYQLKCVPKKLYCRNVQSK